MECVATCRPGLEAVLAGEIKALDGEDIRPSKRAVYFRTDLAGVYRLNMALRTAIQVLVPLRTFNARDYQLLYYQARRTNWHQYFTAEKTLRIDVNGHSPNLRNTQYVVHRIKDGIVDTFRKLADGQRPSIDKAVPEIHIVGHLDRNEVTLCLDSSGVPLFKRGYRQEHGGAPIKEDLAAGILLLSGIENCAGLVDPLCGSGTFLFEGAMIAGGIAPNRDREFSFQHWLDYDPELHAAEKEKLKARETPQPGFAIQGCELEAGTLELARRIRDQHFPEARVELVQSRFEDWETKIPGALLVANPPYGERLGADEDLGPLYRELGFAARRMVPGGRLAVFTTNRKAARQIPLKAESALTLFNGSLEGLLYQYSVRTVPA